MSNFINSFKRRTALMVHPTVAALASAVPLHLAVQCQISVLLFTTMARQFNIFKQVLFSSSYHDPGQLEEIDRYLWVDGIDEDYYEVEDPCEIDQPFVEIQRPSMTCSIVGGVVDWFSHRAWKFAAGYEHRCHQTGTAFRRISPQEQDQEGQRPLVDVGSFRLLPMGAYRQALDDDKDAWGIITKDNLSAHFIRPFELSTLLPALKPKRTLVKQYPTAKNQGYPIVSLRQY